MDRRQLKTRRAIYDAFTSLLGEKSYSAMTVQDIIDRADVGRSTFYAHFETKDELLKSLCLEIFDHVFSENLTRENTHDFSAGSGDLKSEITHILYHLQSSGGSISRILAGESGEVFMRFFREPLTKVFEGELQKRKCPVPKDYMLNHLVSAFAETVRWWMSNRNYSPEEVSGFFFASEPFIQ